MKISDLRELTVDELSEKLLELRKEQFQLRLSKANGALSKPHLITQIRKAVARIKTIITEKVGVNDAK